MKHADVHADDSANRAPKAVGYDAGFQRLEQASKHTLGYLLNLVKLGWK